MLSKLWKKMLFSQKKSYFHKRSKFLNYSFKGKKKRLNTMRSEVGFCKIKIHTPGIYAAYKTTCFNVNNIL